jgi:hypothetical protein
LRAEIGLGHSGCQLGFGQAGGRQRRNGKSLGIRYSGFDWGILNEAMNDESLWMKDVNKKSKLKAQSSKLKAQSSKLKAQSSKLKAQSELGASLRSSPREESVS